MQTDSLSVRAGKNLKRIIKEHDLTQEEFAGQMFVDPTTVRRWLSNGIDKLSILEEIAKFFDISVTDILY